MVEMELNKIIIDEKRQEQIIVLKEKKGERMMPIVIGFVEAASIKMSLSGVVPPRPLTHDLFCHVLAALKTGLKKVLIDKLEEGTFYAKLVLGPLSGASNETIVDARPSDSIAIAVRLKAPVFVAEDVLQKADMFHPGA